MAEKYLELYKKYRPKVWEDVIGQEGTIATLKPLALNKKIPTGFMFFGTHGCGKTSSAFLLAKALNCENLQEDGNPCNECETCKSIDNGSQMGVRYISMANQGSAEDARKLTQEASFAQPIPVPIIIADECHRLSPTAWDSFLIPLESGKNKTLYIFCSTEPEKIPKTILSRLQTRTFNPVGEKELAVNLMKIAKKENLEITKEQIIQVVRSSNGSVRDSISLMETLISNGVLPEQYSEQVLRLIASAKYTDLYSLTAEMSANGQNFAEVSQRLYSDMTNILIMMSGGKPAVTYPAMTEVAGKVSPKLIIAYLSILGDTITSMSRNTVDSRILFDIGLSKIVTLNRKANGGK